MEDSGWIPGDAPQLSRHVSKHHLMPYIKVLVHNVEELISATGEQTGEIAIARERLHASLRAAKERVSDITRQAADRSKTVTGATDEYVRANPWQAVGIAAGVGVLVGFLTCAAVMALVDSRR